ncbi:MAG: WD40/YVTN/BNR-like repeat-containing protein, partial [Candidatus Binatia bacterium]
VDMAICLSPNGTTTYTGNQPSHEVLVGTVNGVYVIARESLGQWRVARNALASCHVSSLLIEPRSGKTFCGTHWGTLYASANLGNTWEVKNNGVTQDHVYSLGRTEVDGKVKLFAGTEPAHLFTSDDLGENWNELPALRLVPSVPNWTFPAAPHVAHVKNITFDPLDSRTIYIGIEQGGLLKSEDQGSTWRELHGFHDDVHRLLIRRSDPKWLYISSGDGLFNSRDGGESWEQLTTRSMRIGYPDALFIHPDREELMFMAGGINAPSKWRFTGDANATIARSRDAGRSWEIVANGLPEHMQASIEAMAMEVYEGSFALFAGNSDGEIYSSEDEGNHWAKIIDGLPPISKGRHYQGLREGARARAV